MWWSASVISALRRWKQRTEVRELEASLGYIPRSYLKGRKKGRKKKEGRKERRRKEEGKKEGERKERRKEGKKKQARKEEGKKADLLSPS
jgi:hypothetical protein